MLLALALLTGCGPACGERSPLVLSGGGDDARICAAVATTARQRRAGLTAHPPLSGDQGLLIEFPVTDTICITTEPMTYAIDIYFIAEDGRVLAAGCARGPEDPLICQPGTRRVLEVLPRPECAARVGGTLGPP